MRRLSATDAIQPAWEHTRRLTVGTRRWGLVFKMAALAYFARLGGCSAHYNQVNGSHAHSLPAPVHAALVGMFVLIGVVLTVLALIFFYVSSRLQFVLFESVLRNDTALAPIWGRYGRATWYWIGLKLLFFAVVLVCIAPIVLPVLWQFVHLLRATHGHPQPAAMFTAFVGMFGAGFFALLAIGVAHTLLMDFGLPSMALEGTSLGETVARIGRLLRSEPGPMVLYLVMRFVLALAASIVCALATAVVLVAGLVPMGAAAVGDWIAFRHASVGGHAAMVTVWVVLVLLFLALLFVTVIVIFGYAQVFFQAYALYFLGGRYPLLGEYLEPTMPLPVGYGYPPMDAGPLAG